MTSKQDPNVNKSNDSTFDFLQSIGLTGKVGGVGLNLGVGHANLAKMDESNTSYKAQFDFNVGDAALAYDLYAVNSDVDYDGLGAHHGLSLTMPVGTMNWMSQVRYTHTENSAEFTPRTKLVATVQTTVLGASGGMHYLTGTKILKSHGTTV